MKNEVATPLYNDVFYDSQIDGSLASARAILPMVLDLVPAKSVCDIGCGAGTWLAAFQERGVETVQGYDGSWVQQDKLKIPVDNFSPADLSKPIVIGRKFDLSMSVEVAEHLPQAAADGFVDTLTTIAPVVLFSAAIPNQGGTGHITSNGKSTGYQNSRAEALSPSTASAQRSGTIRRSNTGIGRIFFFLRAKKD